MRVVGILAGLALALPIAATAMTADELIAKNIAARGGLEAIRALHSLKLSGKLQAGGFEAEVAELKRDGKVRSELSIQGMTQIRAFDGQEGWTVSPFGGRKDAQKLSEDDLKDLRIEADLEGPLVDYAKKGHQVEYLGSEDVDGTAAHKLRVKFATGNEAVYFFDPDHFLEIRVISKSFYRGSEFEGEADLGDYEQVNGVWIPFSVASGAKGSAQKSTVTYERGEANVDLADSLFAFPSGGQP
jgi:outer membrane lipoprotein-sorting protein